MKRALLDRILADRAARRSFVLATRLSDGARELLYPDAADATDPAAPGDPSDPALVATARTVLATDRAETIERPDGPWLLVPESPPVRVHVLGAVHISQALVPLAKVLGLELTIIDPRRAFATAERFPGVTLTTEWPAAAFERLGLDHRTAIVALTHDKKLDDPAIALALRSPAFYIGALGSRKTQDARNARLREAGFGDADIARIHGPIGLPLGGRSPAEVALAILAEIVQCLRAPAARTSESPA